MPIARALGTMVVCGYAKVDIAADLKIALRLGASCVEILPHWPSFPDAGEARLRVEDSGLRVHSVHGCWGGQSIKAARVDLAAIDESARRASVDDIRRCVEWTAKAGGAILVVHPGALSDPNQLDQRRAALRESLEELIEPCRDANVTLCVENMPPGVHPGSRMRDLADLIRELDVPQLGLALDTGHAHLTSSPAHETFIAATDLFTTHVHDNNGRQDSHLPPGLGTIRWSEWVANLDEIGYRGPIMLECIRHLREHPEVIDEQFVELIATMTGEGHSR